MSRAQRKVFKAAEAQAISDTEEKDAEKKKASQTQFTAFFAADVFTTSCLFYFNVKKFMSDSSVACFSCLFYRIVLSGVHALRNTQTQILYTVG